MRVGPARWCLAGLVALAACGDGGTEAAAGSDDLRTAAEEFGQAYLTGDASALLELIEPSAADEVAEHRESLEALGRPEGSVELRDFELEITHEDERSARVSYAGEVCAPTLTNVFPSTSVSGDADDQVPLASEGTIVEGDVECHDIRAASPMFWQIEFVKVDDRWYGRLSGSSTTTQ